MGNYLRVNTTAKVPPVPFGLRIFKGSKTFRLPRHFVEFLVYHEVAQTYIDWSRKQISPEEQIIPSLARISSMNRTNGSWSVEQNYVPLSGRLQLALWRHEKPLKAPCYGTWRNNVCVFSIRCDTFNGMVIVPTIQYCSKLLSSFYCGADNFLSAPTMWCR